MPSFKSYYRWGVTARNPQADDPRVWQGVNGEPIAWYPEHRKCSVFLAVMLHYQAVSGGFRFCGRADVPDQTDYWFEKHGWTYYGEINSITAYSRPNQVVCVMPPGDLPFVQKWSVLAGAKTRGDLGAIEESWGWSSRNSRYGQN